MAVSLLLALPLAADAGWEAAVRDIEALAQPLGFNWSKAQLLSSKASSRAAQPAVSYFLRSFDGSGSIPIVDEAVAARLEGVTNLRLLPGTFPEGMDYHFDGLAAVLSLTVANGSLNFRTKTFLSNAGRNYSACLFMGVGDSKPGPVPCFQNPAVNLLPIAGQLWLTVDQLAVRAEDSDDDDDADRTYAFPPPVDLDAYAAACRLPPAEETEDEREARFQRERCFGL